MAKANQNFKIIELNINFNLFVCNPVINHRSGYGWYGYVWFHNNENIIRRLMSINFKINVHYGVSVSYMLYNPDFSDSPIYVSNSDELLLIITHKKSYNNYNYILNQLNYLINSLNSK